MKFRPDIAGLRAVAVITVLGFHAGVPFFGGGYVGVDVFFVISGFLITGLLLSQQKIRLGEFYARRARRILPAAAVVLVGTALASWILLPPLRQRDVALDVAGAALNVANWRFIGAQTDYLAAGQAHSPLLHYWSLAVEEQFYLLWAPMLLLLRRFAVWAMGLFTLASFALSLSWTQTSEPLAYLSSPSRAWQFGLGGLLAYALSRRTVSPAGRYPEPAHRPHSRAESDDGGQSGVPGVGRGNRWRVFLRAFAALSGLAAIVLSTTVFTTETPFPGWAALLPTLGAAAIIYAGPSSLVGRLLSLSWVRRIGRLSFAWYLWHWPVLVLVPVEGWVTKLGLVLASAIPAWLTMRLVEIPLRRSKTLSVSPRPSLSFGATMIVVPLTLALVFGSVATRQADAAVAAPADLAGAVDGPNLTVTPIAGMFPSPLEARKDHPQIDNCQVEPAAVSSPSCLFGTGTQRIVLFGDSHASQWFPVAQRIAASRGWSVEVLTKSGCPIPEVSITNPQLGRAYRECDTWRDYALRRIASGPPPKLILLGTLNRYSAENKWDGPVKKLAATGAPIVYFKDTPFPGQDIPACLSAGDPSKCGFSRVQALWADAVAGVTVVNVNDVLCPGLTCPAVREGVVLYRDDSHLTNTAVTVLAPRIEKTLVGFGVLS
jgi:peptidoglycan/LPS O-acetylase OafA/YrhL